MVKNIDLDLILDYDKDNMLFEERENMQYHAPYIFDVELRNYIRNGNVDGVNSLLQSLSGTNYFVGKLSSDNLRQLKYLGVSFISVGIREAINGGLPAEEAYNLSDLYIQQIDEIQNHNSILEKIFEIVTSLATAVDQSKYSIVYPTTIKICMSYIYKHLHNKITVNSLADECGLNPDYLSSLFKKTVGKPITTYITELRLEAAKDLILARKYRIIDIAFYLNFCSESYFIMCFKKYFGITPRQFSNSLSY